MTALHNLTHYNKISAGLTGAVAVISSLASVSFMAVPDALCIIFACPVVTILLSALLLGDKINLVKVESGQQCEVLMLINETPRSWLAPCW